MSEDVRKAWSAALEGVALLVRGWVIAALVATVATAPPLVLGLVTLTWRWALGVVF